MWDQDLNPDQISRDAQNNQPRISMRDIVKSRLVCNHPGCYREGLFQRTREMKRAFEDSTFTVVDNLCAEHFEVRCRNETA